MTKAEIHLALVKLREGCIPNILDPTLKTIFRIGMNQAFMFGVKNTATDSDFKKNALEIIDEWENQFNIDIK